MSISKVHRGQKVTNKYGETLTVLEVIGGLMVRTYEQWNDLYHFRNLFIDGKKIEF